MSNKLKLLIVMCLVFAMAFSTTACKNKPVESSSEPSSSEESIIDESSEEDSSDEELDEEFDDYFDEEFEEEETIFYSDLLVENGSAPINEHFYGVNGVHMGWGFMPDIVEGRNPLSKTMVEQEYDRIAYTMGVKQVRTMYTSAFAWDEEKGVWDWDLNSNKVLSGFYDSLKAWQDRGVEVCMSPQWSLAGFVGLSSNDSNPISGFYGNGFYVKDDLDATLKNYRDFMKETVTSLKQHGIHNVKYLFAYTECNNTYKSNNDKALAEENSKLAAEGKPQIEKTTIELRDYETLYGVYDKAITALDGALKDAGVRSSYKIVGPCDNFRTDFEYTDPEQYSLLSKYTLENLADKVDIIGAHGGYSYANEFIEETFYYNPSVTMSKTKEMAEKAGKEFWVDEYNVHLNDMHSGTMAQYRESLNSPFKGIAIAAAINGILNMGADNIFLWALADQQWPNNTNNIEFNKGLQIGGYLPAPSESVMPYNAWYSVSLLSRYIGQGKVYSCFDDIGIFVSCVERTDGEWTVIVTNYNVMDTPVHVNFEKTLGGKTFYRHLYDVNTVIPNPDAEIIGVSAKAENVTTGFYDTLPGYSVAVYTTVKD